MVCRTQQGMAPIAITLLIIIQPHIFAVMEKGQVKRVSWQTGLRLRGKDGICKALESLRPEGPPYEDSAHVSFLAPSHLAKSHRIVEEGEIRTFL